MLSWILWLHQRIKQTSDEQEKSIQVLFGIFVDMGVFGRKIKTPKPLAPKWIYLFKQRTKNCGAVIDKGAWARPVQCDTVTRKYVGKVLEEKGDFSRFVYTGPFCCRLPVSGDNNVLLLVQGEHLSPGKFHGLLLGRKWEVREPFLCLSPESWYLQLKVI